MFFQADIFGVKETEMFAISFSAVSLSFIFAAACQTFFDPPNYGQVATVVVIGHHVDNPIGLLCAGLIVTCFLLSLSVRENI